jgi:hypothetical protein
MRDPGKMAVLHLRPCFSDTPQIFHDPSLFLFAHSSNELGFLCLHFSETLFFDPTFSKFALPTYALW